MMGMWGGGPGAIGLDLFFAEPDRFSPAAIAAEIPILPTEVARALQLLPSNAQLLADAVRGRHVVLGIGAGEGVDVRLPGPPRAAPVVTSGERHQGLRNWPGYIGSLAVIDSAAQSRGLMNSVPQDQIVRLSSLPQPVQRLSGASLGLQALRSVLGSAMRSD